jgi:hypothetical protein
MERRRRLGDMAREVLLWGREYNLGSCQTADIYLSHAKQRDLLSLLTCSDFTFLLQTCTILGVLQVTFIALDKPCCEEGNDLGSCQIVSSDPSDARQRELLSLLAYSDFTSRLQNCTIQGVLQVTCITLDKLFFYEEGNDLGSCQTVSMYPSDAKQRVLLILLVLDCKSRLQNCKIQGAAQVAWHSMFNEGRAVEKIRYFSFSMCKRSGNIPTLCQCRRTRGSKFHIVK